MFRYLYWFCVLWVVCVFGCTSEQEEDTTSTDTSSDCVSCKTDQTDLNEYLKFSKISQRLKYIKQQLVNNLRIDGPPDLLKTNVLPPFLIERLFYPPSQERNYRSFNEAKNSEVKQVVLFPVEESRNCYHALKKSLCLEFILSDEFIANEVSSAVIWFNEEQFVSNGTTSQHFTIIDKNSLNRKSRRNKRSKIHCIPHKDGWFEINVVDIVRSWLTHNDIKKLTLIIACDTCDHIVVDTRQAYREKDKIPYLLLNTEKEKNSRSKRGVDCIPGNNNDECCRETLEVNFKELGDYNMVYHPTKFNAYVCRGNCYYHSATSAEKPYASLLVKLKLNNSSKLSLPTSCCTPTKFSSLPVLYASSNSAFVQTSIPNMIVESCGCI